MTLWLVVHSKIRDVCGLEFVYLYMTSGLAYHSQSFFIFFFFSGQKYVLRVRAKDKGSPPLTSDTIRVRIDSIDAEQTMVDLELDISLEEFEANRELFIER